MTKLLATLLFLLYTLYTQAQVKIGNNPNSIDANSLLELESTNKGFLAPRVTLTSISSVSPLTGTVPAGMLVYNSAGSLTFGYYYWDGTEWKKLDNGNKNLVTKTASATLLKSETIVLASNDIILTLPVVTSADNGLELSVKNNGAHTDQVTVKGNGSATIDGSDSANITRHVGHTFVATGGNWVIKGNKKVNEHFLDVNPNSSWTTIQEVIDFLEVHMTGPTVIRLGEEIYEIDATINVDLPFDVTFQGMSYGVATLAAATGLAGTPMFRCISACYFKMLNFDATTLTNYGTVDGEDAIRFLGSGTYNEVKDCSFDRFYNTILDSTDAEIWVFETDISNSQGSGILVHGADAGVTVKVAETDFIGCNYGINLSKGSGATIQLATGGYYNGASGDTAIFYQPATFTSFSVISITGNTWNNTGKYIEGFDFTRTDGRDANATVESNAGMGDKKPNCYINVTNNATTTTLTSSGSWYKINWTTTSSTTTKWTIGNNRITYQPNNRRDGFITISGNISVSNSAAVFNIGIVKNPSGSSATSGSITRYGETTLRPGVANQPVQFSTVIYLSDIGPGDFFELWCNSNSNSMTITIQDTQWLVNAQ